MDFLRVILNNSCEVFKKSRREKCLNTEFLLVCIFPHLDWYGEIRSISPYSVQMRENTDQENSVFGHFSRSECYGEGNYQIIIYKYEANILKYFVPIYSPNAGT